MKFLDKIIAFLEKVADKLTETSQIKLEHVQTKIQIENEEFKNEQIKLYVGETLLDDQINDLTKELAALVYYCEKHQKELPQQTIENLASACSWAAQCLDRCDGYYVKENSNSRVI